MSVKIEILDYVYNNANVLDWEKSILGELDVTDHSDFPLAMTFQISDIKDLTSTSGDYSKTFKIPATKNNNKLLKHSYIANIDTDVNLTENKKCRILVNNLFSLKGLIKITGIGGFGETPSYYNCVFFGNNISWADDLSNKYMDTIDWGANSKDIAYNKTNIMATWQHEDCDAAAAASAPPIVYPIVSYGDYNADGEPKTIQLLDTRYDTLGGAVGMIGYYGFHSNGESYGTPLPSPDWRPAIFIKDTLERIFASAGDGYKINSTFMETDMFKRLVWSLPNFKYNNPEEKSKEYSYGNTFTGEGLISNTLIAPTNPPFDNVFTTFSSVINLNDAGADFVLNSGTDNTGWDASTGIYTIQEYGYYTIELNNFGLFAERNHYNGGTLLVDYAKIITQVQTAGQSSWNNIDYIQTGSVDDSGGSTPLSTPMAFSGSINQEIYLNKNDKLRLNLFVRARSVAYTGNKINLYLFGSSTPTSPTLSDNANAKYSISINSNRVEYGQTYDLEDVINTDYKQMDFVKGVAHAFNLQISTDESARVVNIEPFDTFYKDYAHAIDWTYKLDRSKQIEDKWIKSDLKRDVVFKYKSDSKDKKVEARGEQYFDGIKDEYPYQETLPKTFEKGESKYENPFFAGTYNPRDNDNVQFNLNDNPYSACLWEEDVAATNGNDRPKKGFEFLPRLLYWKKYSPAISFIYSQKQASVQTWANVFSILKADASASTVLNAITSNIYPQATSYNRDDISSPILSYGNVTIKDYNNVTAQYASSVSGKGLFETYYKTMFEMLKAKPRLRTVYIDLKVKDIVSLDFTKLIYIDGVYWRINKVVDYQPNKNQSTKVELIEWLQLGTFAATAPSFDGYTDPWDTWNPQDGSADDNQDIGL